MKSFSLICPDCGTVNDMSRTHCLACGQVLGEENNNNVLISSPIVSSLSKTLLKQRYRIMHVIGKGGMGTVYIGTDTQLGNRLVAIKEMSQSGLTPLERQMAARSFQREAHLLAGLQHPNLPSIYDHFEESQRWYFVMSFIKGQTLTDYLNTKGGRLDSEEVLEIGIVLCSVLDYLHTHHPPIVFRDLKPANIMRTVDGHIYLIDFGIARFFKTEKLRDMDGYGSVGYASPEQYGSTPITPSSDIYSLGATLYHLLSGYEPARTPFHLPTLHSLAPSAPPQLVALISQMLDLDKFKRPTSVESIKRELQNIANDFTVATPKHPVSSSRSVLKRAYNIFRSLIIFAREKRQRHTEIPLFAIAHTTLEFDDQAIVGNTYILQAGITQQRQEISRSKPSGISEQTILFHILLHLSQNIELMSTSYQSLPYNPSSEIPQLISYSFRLRSPGQSYLLINFYRERQWLKTIHFAFDGIEQPKSSTLEGER